MAEDPWAGLPKLSAPEPAVPTTHTEIDPDNPWAGLPSLETPKDEPSTAQLVESGLVTGAGAQTLGLPVDMVTGAANAVYGSARQIGSAIAHPLDYLSGDKESVARDLARQKQIAETPLIEHPWGGSAWWNKRLGEVGLPTTENVVPTDPGNKLLQQGARGVGAFVAPGGIGKAVARVAPRVGEALMSLTPGMAEADTIGGVAGAGVANAAYGATSGAAGEAAAQAFPDSHAARALGEMAGAAVPAVGAAGATRVGRFLRDTEVAPPFTGAGRQEMGAQRGVAAFDKTAGPQSASDIIQARIDADEAELIPGSRQTTGELTEDPELLALQRARMRLAPSESRLGEDVKAQNIGNVNARGALTDVPSGVAPISDAQAYVKRHLADIDKAHEDAIALAQANADAVKPSYTMTPEEQGQAVAGSVEAERAPTAALLTDAQRTAQERLEQATEQYGGKEALGTPDEREAARVQAGAAMRDPAQEAYLAERARLSQVREAIDPAGTKGMSVTPIKEALAEIRDKFHPDTFGGMENKLYGRVDNEFGGLVTLEDAMRLRADINARLKNVFDRNPQEELRLGTLKRGIDEAISQAAAEAEKTVPGVADRLAGLAKDESIVPTVGQDVSATAARSVGREVPAGPDAGAAPLRPGAVSPETGASGAAEGRPGGGAGDQGLPGETPAIAPVSRETPEAAAQAWAERTLGKEAVDRAVPAERAAPEITPLTPEDRALVAQWNREYREMMQAYQGETPGKLHAVGKMLQKGGPYDVWKVEDRDVPGLFKSKAAVEKFLEKAPPESVAALDNHFGFSLRSAMKGEPFNLKEYDKWLKANEGPMSARPELLEKFNTAAKAKRQLDGIEQALAEHEAAYPLKPGWGEAGILKQYFKPGPTGGEAMDRFLSVTGGRPEALAAARDYAIMDLIGRSGVIKDGKVVPSAANAWIKQHDNALSRIPGLKDELSNAASAQQAVEDALSAHAIARKEYTKSVAAAFAQGDPDKVAANLFQGNNRAQNAKSLFDIVSRDPAALEGTQRAIIKHIKDNYQQVLVPGAEHKGFAAQQFQNFLRQNRDVIEVFFPGGAVKNFDLLAEDLRKAQLLDASKLKGGSDTTELLNRSGHGEEHANATSTGQIAALIGIEHLTNHLMGAIAGSLSPIAVAISLTWARWAKGKVAAAAADTLDRMLLDPKTAIAMREKYGTSNRVSLTARFAQRLMQVGIDGARADDLQPPKKQNPFAKGGRIHLAGGGDPTDPSGWTTFAEPDQPPSAPVQAFTDPSIPPMPPGESPDEQARHLSDWAAAARDRIPEVARDFGRGIARGVEAGATGEPIEGEGKEPITHGAEIAGAIPGAIAGTLVSPIVTGAKALEATTKGEPVSPEEMLTASMAGMTSPVARLPGGVPSATPTMMERLWADETGAKRIGPKRGIEPVPEVESMPTLEAAQPDAAGVAGGKAQVEPEPEPFGPRFSHNAPPPTPSRTLSYELDFGAGAPFNEQFPEWQGLSVEDKTRISKTVLDQAADFAMQTAGGKEVSRIAGTGGWQEYTNPSFRSRMEASPQEVADAANILGYLAQQTAIYETHLNPEGSQLGLMVHGPGLDSDAAIRAIWSEVVQKHPDLAQGFSPTRDAQGVPGIEMTFGDIEPTLQSRVETELWPTFNEAAQKLGIDATPEFFRADTQLHSNNWEMYPDGREYKDRLVASYGPEIQGRLDTYRRSQLEPALRQEIDRATGKSGEAAAVRQEPGPRPQELAVAPRESEPPPSPPHRPLGEDPNEIALTARDILHPDTPSQKPRSRDVETIAAELENRGKAALQAMGVSDGKITGPSPVTDEIISRAIASEVKDALARSGHAGDWYTAKVAEAMQTASELYPEIATDHNAKTAFTAALAVTSQGETVSSNVRLADQVYRYFRENGRFPTDVAAKAREAINGNFDKLNKLLDRLGPDGTRDFLSSEFTVRELEKLTGETMSREKKDTLVYGSAILGPKIGHGFFQNLNGNFTPVTMDLWFMRGWGRLTGTLTGKPEAVVTAQRSRLLSAIRGSGEAFPASDAAIAERAQAIVSEHERNFRNFRQEFDSGARAKDEATLAAEAYLRGIKGINETPTSGGHRAWIRDRVDRARELLASEGVNLTNADLQAAWWYPEKELYSKLGGRDAEGINVDYATAWRDLANNRSQENAGQPAPAVGAVDRRSRPASAAPTDQGGTRQTRRGSGTASGQEEAKRGSKAKDDKIGRADGGGVSGFWRAMNPEAQARHLANYAQQIRDQIHESAA